MRIWLINHYAVPPNYYPLARPTLFAKNLIKMGHKVTIIAASTAHNSDVNLINGKEKYKKEIVEGVPYIYIKCSSYKGNRLGRIINIIEFAWKLNGLCDRMRKPDAIVATSFDPISCYRGITYAKKHGIKAIAEIADLWPETLVAYGIAKGSNPIVRILRHIEKKIYLRSDAVIFTMEGGYDYIKERGWENAVLKSKIAYINNGIDLSEFDQNCKKYKIKDIDLDSNYLFNIVYAGAIRKVNNLGLLLDTAKLIKNPMIQILIWGDGDEMPSLEKRINDEGISNVKFKGRVDKKYIPYIASKADINILHNEETPIMRFGLSLNKLFDYLAAGRPILVDFHANYNPVLQHDAGVESKNNTPAEIAVSIEEMFSMEEAERIRFSVAARKSAEKFDFHNLTKDLVDVINRI